MNLCLRSIKHTIEAALHIQAIKKSTLCIKSLIIIIMVKLMRFQMSLQTGLGFVSSKMCRVASPLNWGVFFPQVLQAVMKVEHPRSGSLHGVCLFPRETGISQNGVDRKSVV